MLDIAWPELLLVGAVALVAVGPKDLPKVMHGMGVFAGKLRRAWLGLQHEFERVSFEAEQLAREEELRRKKTQEKEKQDDGGA